MRNQFENVEYVNTIWGIGRIVRRYNLLARVIIDGYEVDIAYKDLTPIKDTTNIKHDLLVQQIATTWKDTFHSKMNQVDIKDFNELCRINHIAPIEPIRLMY